MAHYDQATRDFITKVAGDNEEKKPKVNPVVSQTLGIAKDISKSHTRRDLEAALVKRVVRAATGKTFEHLEKTSGVSALNVYKLLNDNYGSDWHDWEPETLWQTLELEHAIKPSEEIKNLVQALQVICNTNFPFEDFSVFENIVHALNMSPVYFGSIQSSELDDIAMAIKILKLIRPKEEFEDDILGYIAACAKKAGVVYLPGDLFPEECQEFLDKIGNDLELKEKVIKNSSGEDVAVQKEKLQEIRDYISEV